MTAALPPVGLIVSVSPGERRAALVEQGRVVELRVQRGPVLPAGHIFRAQIITTDPASGGAILSLGDGLEAFLPQARLAAGSRLTVQLVKPPAHGKRAEVRRRLELAGTFLVLMPGGSGIEAARKLPDDRRTALKHWAAERLMPGEGLMIRSAAVGADEQALMADLAALRQQAAALVLAGPPGPAHPLPDPAAALLAEFPGDCPVWLSGAVLPGLGAGAGTRLQRLPPLTDAFTHFALDDVLAEALQPRLALPEGGGLEFAETAAAVMVDMDTGGLGAMPLPVWAEAALRHAVRQIRLRGLAGLILLDPPRQIAGTKLLPVLTSLLAQECPDATLCGLTRSGLLEVIRPRRAPSLAEMMLAPPEPLPLTAAAVCALLRQAVAEPQFRGLDVSRTADQWLSGPGAPVWQEFVDRLGYVPRRRVREGTGAGRIITRGEDQT